MRSMVRSLHKVRRLLPCPSRDVTPDQAFQAACESGRVPPGSGYVLLPEPSALGRGMAGRHSSRIRRALEQRRRWLHVGPPELTWSLGLLLSAGVE